MPGLCKLLLSLSFDYTTQCVGRQCSLGVGLVFFVTTSAFCLLAHTHSLTLSLSLSHTHTLSLSLNLTHSHTHTHTHTHTRTHTHSHTHTRHRLHGGELFDYLTQKDFLNEGEATNYMKQILGGMAYTHSQKIIHLDLKVNTHKHKQSHAQHTTISRTWFQSLYLQCTSPQP